MKLLFIYTIYFISIFYHADHVAEYNYTLDQNHIILKMTIDKEELLNFNFKTACNLTEMTALCTEKYLTQHAFIEINQQKVRFSLEGSYTENGHFIMNLKSTEEFTSIKTISVFNNSFQEFDKHFKNRIILNLGKFNQSYMLTKGQNKITLE